MKKILLFLTFVTSVSVASAQCTPDMQYAGDSGIHPDSATNFAPAYVGTPYAQTVTAVIPADTCVIIVSFLPCQVLSFDSVIVTSVTGLPANFSFTCAPPNCRFLGNSIDCAIITGTAQPGQEGTYDLTINLDAYVGGFSAPNSFTLDYYKIVVLPALSTPSLNGASFSIAQNQPNPFSDITQIDITAANAGLVEFEVLNLVGQVVHSRSISVVAGKNQIGFDAADLPSGTYLYRISMGNTTQTRRMVISR